MFWACIVLGVLAGLVGLYVIVLFAVDRSLDSEYKDIFGDDEDGIEHELE